MKNALSTITSFPKDFVSYIKDECALVKKHKKAMVFIVIATVVIEVAFAALNAYALKRDAKSLKERFNVDDTDDDVDDIATELKKSAKGWDEL